MLNNLAVPPAVAGRSLFRESLRPAEAPSRTLRLLRCSRPSGRPWTSTPRSPHRSCPFPLRSQSSSPHPAASASPGPAHADAGPKPGVGAHPVPRFQQEFEGPTQRMLGCGFTARSCSSLGGDPIVSAHCQACPPGLMVPVPMRLQSKDLWGRNVVACKSHARYSVIVSCTVAGTCHTVALIADFDGHRCWPDHMASST